MHTHILSKEQQQAKFVQGSGGAAQNLSDRKAAHAFSKLTADLIYRTTVTIKIYFTL